MNELHNLIDYISSYVVLNETSLSSAIDVQRIKKSIIVFIRKFIFQGQINFSSYTSLFLSFCLKLSFSYFFSTHEEHSRLKTVYEHNNIPYARAGYRSLPESIPLRQR